MRPRFVAFVVAGIASVVVPVPGAQATPVEPRSPLCVSVPGGGAGDVAVVNVTNPGASGVGYGALRSSGSDPVPGRAVADQFSSVNFAPGPANPNLAFVTIGDDGRVCYDSDGASSEVILDVAAVVPGANVNATEPTRLLDTRAETVGGSPGTFDIELRIFFEDASDVENARPAFDAYVTPDPTFGTVARQEFPSGRAVWYGTVLGEVQVDADSGISGSGTATAGGGFLYTSVGPANAPIEEVRADNIFAVTCPRSPNGELNPIEIFRREIPVLFSGTVFVDTDGEEQYQISMAAGTSAQHGRSGGVPDETVVFENDFESRCSDAYANCTSLTCYTRPGLANYPTIESVLDRWRAFHADHLAVDSAFVANSVIDLERFVDAGRAQEVPVSSADDVIVDVISFG